ncbi:MULTISPECIES: hypothetical protein [Sphingobacterium]|uniref:GlyGly-CTERM sorting domain-containing protein n=1 Tax=Sphingobacterium tenebrionis TaxID=3111775 RepID=A0ABU8I3F1_9SPHI|nr:hypothetical protein [Sphingobacterium sp. 1.A.4]
MKNMLILKTRALALIMFVLMSVQAFAQEKGLDINVDVDKGDSNMFAQPWVWIVGGAVFILLLVALLRGGSKK